MLLSQLCRKLTLQSLSGNEEAARRLVRAWRSANPVAGGGARIDGRRRGILCTGHATLAADVTNAFWRACDGGQRLAGEYLLSRGAGMNCRIRWAYTDGRGQAKQR